MSNLAFVVLFFGLIIGLYIYVSKKWEKRQKEVDDFAFEMQKEFAFTTQTIKSSVNYFTVVQNFYEKEGFTVSKNTDFATDFIAKKDKTILFIRVQALNNTADITSKDFQIFVGQTVLYALERPIYESYKLQWAYVSSASMCDQSARVFINSHKERLKFELIEI